MFNKGESIVKAEIEKRFERKKKELREVYKMSGLDFWEGDNCKNCCDLDGRQKEITRNMVINYYLQIDLKFNILIANYFFGHCVDDYDEVVKITKSKKFILFDSCVLEEMPFLKKFRLLKEIIEIPKEIKGDIEKINDLRNAVSHAFIPEKLKNNRTLYKTKSIFTLEGLKKFNDDMGVVFEFLQKHFCEAIEGNRCGD